MKRADIASMYSADKVLLPTDMTMYKTSGMTFSV